MNRRRSLHVLTVGLAAAVSGVRAQQEGKVPVVGLLLVTAGPNDTIVNALRRGLRELGYIDGSTIRIEYRGAQGDIDRLPALAQELVQLKVDAIVSGAKPALRAAKQATSSIPIVMAMYDYDPVAQGLVESLSRPGGNVTGVFSLQAELVGKRLELIKEVFPKVTRVAVFWDTFSQRQLDALNPVARSLGLELVPVALAGSYDYDAAFAVAKKSRAGAALVLFSPMFYVHRVRIGTAALASRLGIVSQDRDIVESGGLISYGPTSEELFGRAAYFIDRLLKGAKPSELPVEQPSTLWLAVNLKTAKALKLTIPESVMLRADEVLR